MARSSRARAVFIVRWAGLASALCLAALWAVYHLTVEPSASVKVHWREGLPAERRAELERRYLLVYTEDAPEAWTRYDLLDTRRVNIAALVRDPDAADTTDIDREAMTVPFHVEYGQAWMWAAHRTPGLRQPGARRAVIGGLAALGLVAGLLELRRRPRDDADRV